MKNGALMLQAANLEMWWLAETSYSAGGSRLLIMVSHVVE